MEITLENGFYWLDKFSIHLIGMFAFADKLKSKNELQFLFR